MTQITSRWWKEFRLWNSPHRDVHFLVAVYDVPDINFSTSRVTRDHWSIIVNILFAEFTFEFRRF